MSSENVMFRTNVQKSGVLLKKPFGHSSSKWSKRFFVIKDGFLLYYTEKDGKQFQTDGFFNIHPKGAIPLGGCSVDAYEEPTQPFALRITHPDFGHYEVFLGAESKASREDWIQWLYSSSRVTFKGAQQGDSLVAMLQAKGTELERLRKEAQTRLEAEMEELEQEREERDKFEAMAAMLQEEKEQAQREAQQLGADHSTALAQLEKTSQSVAAMEAKLAAKSKELAETTARVEQQQGLSSQQQAEIRANTQRLQEEQRTLSSQTQNMRDSLMSMKRKTLELEVAQVSAEQRLDDAASKLEGRVHVLQVDKDKWLQAEAAMARLELALQSKDSSIHSELQDNFDELRSFFHGATETAGTAAAGSSAAGPAAAAAADAAGSGAKKTVIDPYGSDDDSD